MAGEKKISENTKAPTPDPRGRCGSTAGYQAHRRRGEKACEACKGAHNEANKARNRGEKVEHKPSKPRRKSMPVELHEPAPVELPPEPAKPTRATATAKREVPEGVPTPPDWLKAKGLELWVEVTQANELNAAGLTLLGEACRTVDRLERMAAALSSRSTLWFELGDLDQATELGVPIVVNGMLGEARQLQTTLRQTLTTLGVVNVDAANKAAKSPLDQLAERRKERIAAQGGA